MDTADITLASKVRNISTLSFWIRWLSGIGILVRSRSFSTLLSCLAKALREVHWNATALEFQQLGFSFCV